MVEIDPQVTRVAAMLGLKEYDDLNIEHDGRPAVPGREGRTGGHDLVILDAVNDLSVPSHLLTKEFNDLVEVGAQD